MLWFHIIKTQINNSNLKVNNYNYFQSYIELLIIRNICYYKLKLFIELFMLIIEFLILLI